MTAPKYDISGLTGPQVDLILQGITKNIADLQALAVSIQQQAQAQFQALQQKAAEEAEAAEAARKAASEASSDAKEDEGRPA